jgi:hypothetical protein
MPPPPQPELRKHQKTLTYPIDISVPAIRMAINYTTIEAPKPPVVVFDYIDTLAYPTYPISIFGSGTVSDAYSISTSSATRRRSRKKRRSSFTRIVRSHYEPAKPSREIFDLSSITYKFQARKSDEYFTVIYEYQRAKDGKNIYRVLVTKDSFGGYRIFNDCTLVSRKQAIYYIRESNL